MPMRKAAFYLCAALVGTAAGRAELASAKSANVTVALLPVSKGNAYFLSCRDGAAKAARELSVNLVFDGPADPDPAGQNAIVASWIDRGVDVIAAACDNKDGISPVLRQARAKGIKVITYDADAAADVRPFFVNQATSESIGVALMNDAAQLCGEEGQYAIIAANVTSDNENEWRKYIAARNRSAFPKMKLVAIRTCNDITATAEAEATKLLAEFPKLKLIMAICSPAVPGAAEAVQKAGQAGKVKVIGLGLPNENRKYVKAGVTNNIILWDTENLGNLTLRAAVALVAGTLKAGDKTFDAGPLGIFQIEGDQIVLGPPVIFDRANIDRYNF